MVVLINITLYLSSFTILKMGGVGPDNPRLCSYNFLKNNRQNKSRSRMFDLQDTGYKEHIFCININVTWTPLTVGQIMVVGKTKSYSVDFHLLGPITTLKILQNAI